METSASSTRIVLTFAIAALISAQCIAQSVAQARVDRSQDGKRLYQFNCAGCHGLDARGGEHAANIATAARSQQMPDAELLRMIRGGIPAAGMPAFGSRLNTEQISAVTAYLRILQGKQTTVALPGNPAVGQRLFFNKAECSECHMIQGKGGFLAADLSSYAIAHSLAQIGDAILNPNRNFDPNHGQAEVVTRDGQQYTGMIRNEDNFSLQLQTWDGGFHLFEKSDLASVTREKGSFMPSDYGSRLTSQELNDVISYLVQIAEKQPKQAQDDSEW
jgi:cytochrome c oxidase cbb3-type subunit III